MSRLRDLTLARLDRGLTLTELNRRVKMGVSHLSEVLRGERAPSARHARNLSGALGMTAPEFISLWERTAVARARELSSNLRQRFGAKE